jgi:hypothetical protein
MSRRLNRHIQRVPPPTCSPQLSPLPRRNLRCSNPRNSSIVRRDTLRHRSLPTRRKHRAHCSPTRPNRRPLHQCPSIHSYTCSHSTSASSIHIQTIPHTIITAHFQQHRRFYVPFSSKPKSRSDELHQTRTPTRIPLPRADVNMKTEASQLHNGSRSHT